jgi:hypothetical protein
MVASVIAAALFFSAATVWKLGEVEDHIHAAPPAPAPVSWPSQSTAPADFDRQIELATQQASYSLEREAMARRYGQAALAFETRLWTRFVGFVTGMILAMVGAAFILGKLDMETSDLSAAAQGVSLTLRSASPGLVLAVLGTILMSLSLLVPVTADTRDGALYFGAAMSPTLPPPDLNTVDSANPASAATEPQPRKK